MKISRIIKSTIILVSLAATFSNFSYADDVKFVDSSDVPHEKMVRKTSNYYVKLSNQILSKQIEGYCYVEYTITTSGTTKDIRILECKKSNNRPTDVFNKYAIKTVSKYQYEPIIINGENVEVRNCKSKYQVKFKK